MRIKGRWKRKKGTFIFTEPRIGLTKEPANKAVILKYKYTCPSASTPGLCLFLVLPLSVPGEQEHGGRWNEEQKSLVHELPYD